MRALVRSLHHLAAGTAVVRARRHRDAAHFALSPPTQWQRVAILLRETCERTGIAIGLSGVTVGTAERAKLGLNVTRPGEGRCQKVEDCSNGENHSKPDVAK